ncbi:Cyanase [Stereum hirsutum FP-91666 SS1]|uniref:Cyanase n=1 Tax=Stereum hirsutum (strain FP-91666) TaxID=721885 RepID=UPI000440C292|nr:Cyanase [Stereum hirsutum FP-91666 SS1]EIM90937.1 Cyanase [Stereum hirsutum FP-91666 SS1]
MSSSSATVSANTAPFEKLPPIIVQLFEAKAKKDLTFEEISKAIGRDEVWTAALFYGQAKGSPEDLKALAEILEIPHTNVDAEIGAHWFPQRGLGPVPPTDPVIYRLFEGILVYGQALKAIIHEKFGDGIMSLIDCKVHVERKPDPKGDRVVVTFDGKFLPYLKW